MLHIESLKTIIRRLRVQRRNYLSYQEIQKEILEKYSIELSLRDIRTLYETMMECVG